MQTDAFILQGPPQAFHEDIVDAAPLAIHRYPVRVRFEIIHNADCQLGKLFEQFPSNVTNALSEARLDAVDKLASVAARQGRRHVLLAGEMLDNVVPSDRVTTPALSRMERANVTSWLMPGNHDHARPKL